MASDFILAAALLLALALLWWKVPSWRAVTGKLWLALASAFGAVLAYRQTTSTTDNNHDREEEGGESLEEATDPRTPPGYPAELPPPPPIDYTRPPDDTIPDSELDADARARAEHRARAANDLWRAYLERKEREDGGG